MLPKDKSNLIVLKIIIIKGTAVTNNRFEKEMLPLGYVHQDALKDAAS